MRKKDQRLVAYGVRTEGRVIAVKTCWWLKINTKPVRLHSLGGAVFPHIITYSYEADGVQFIAKRYVSYKKLCPCAGADIPVYYYPSNPKNSCVII